MPYATFNLVKDILLLLIFLAGTLWMWGWLRFSDGYQQNLEKLFVRSRWRFKWIFLIAFLLLAGSDIWNYFIR